MTDKPIGQWRKGKAEPQTLRSGRHQLSREEVLASQRGRIMRAALLELGSRGAGAMTVGGLVERAKVSKKTFYENFEGLDSCVAESLQTLNILVGGEMAAAADKADQSQPFARLRAVVAELLAAAVDEPVVATALLASGFGLEEENAKDWLQFDDIRTKLAISWYEDERNRTPDLPPTNFARANAAFAALEYAVLRLLVAGQQGELNDQVSEVTALLVEIMSGGKASYSPEVSSG